MYINLRDRQIRKIYHLLSELVIKTGNLNCKNLLTLIEFKKKMEFMMVKLSSTFRIQDFFFLGKKKEKRKNKWSICIVSKIT